ncbi:amino acid adenylation domain-containing protein, partial [Pseudomonas sp. JUb42]|uniref:amino acid adenylation domain-containing protein n=1 Tax=Pseudomonas sp. JUb42 TaxID=2940611 RepID=UPI00216AA78C
MQELLDSVRTLSSKERKALAALLKRQGVNLYSVTPILPRTPEEPLTLSYAQQRQWFLWQLEPQSAAYNLSTALRLKGRLNYPALQRSFETLLQRHESLRTIFLQTPDGVVQSIQPATPLQLNAQAIATDELQGHIEQAVRHCFDLTAGPLFNVSLLRMADEDHALVLVQHHILSDGWSMAIMVDELVQLYQGFCQGQEASLEDLPIQYADYALWQRRWMEAGEQERQLGYWQQQLGGEQPVLELPLDHPRPAVQDYRGAALDVELGAELSQRLKVLAQQQGVTLFMLLLASFQALLQRYSGQNDIRVGVPVANRSRVETEGLIGFFVNTQVLKAEFAITTTVADLLAQVKRTAMQAQAHQDLPFEQLVEALQPERSLSHTPLFQVMFNHQSEARGQARQLSGLRVEALHWDSHTAQFDLSLDTREHRDGLRARLTYATALFDAVTVQGFASHWRALLEGMIAQPHARVAELALMSEAEQAQWLPLLDRRSALGTVYRSVHEQIEEQVRRNPQAIALICDTRQLTYAELNLSANRLAHQLRAHGVGPDVLVGVAVERGLGMVVAVLAVLKAGGAYVPLDPDYPRERLGYMIEDSGIGLLLTHEHLHRQLLLPETVHCLYVEATAEGYGQDNPVNLTRPHNLAYVMYTSGSTGRPKGVAIDLGSLSAHSEVSVGFFNLTPEDRVLQFSTFNFDGFVEQLYPILTLGGSVVIRGPEIWDSETFYRQLIDHDISVVDLTTAYWFMLVKDFARIGPRPYGRLHQMHAGGEAMPPEGIDAWRQAGLAHVVLLNTYGPTEATVTVTAHDCAALVAGTTPSPAMMPIGRTLPGRVIHVLDNQGQLAPPGVTGELLIGGELLARGYFQRAALTAERFIPDPFATHGGARLYRSGDLARYRRSGELEYAGRIDHQVKIRGFRIELGEIEAALLTHDVLRDAKVIDLDGPTGKQLVAYVVPAEPAEIANAAIVETLREALRTQLPDYMLPRHYVLLEQLPLSPNGKLDRKALPAPDMTLGQSAYVEPTNELQRQVAMIWAQVLKVERVGLNDSFFELGGHSLLATQVISRLRQALQVEVALKALFEASDLAGFTLRVADSQRDHAPAFKRIDRHSAMQLSYAQQRQWFLWQLEPGSAVYNIPAALRLKGE